MIDWMISRFGMTATLVVAPLVYATLILLVLLFSDLPTDTFRYLNM